MIGVTIFVSKVSLKDQNAGVDWFEEARHISASAAKLRQHLKDLNRCSDKFDFRSSLIIRSALRTSDAYLDSLYSRWRQAERTHHPLQHSCLYCSALPIEYVHNRQSMNIQMKDMLRRRFFTDRPIDLSV